MSPRLTLDAPPVVEVADPEEPTEASAGDFGSSRSSSRALAVVLMVALAGLLTPMLFPKPQPAIAASPDLAAGRAVGPPAEALLSRTERTPIHVEALVAPPP